MAILKDLIVHGSSRFLNKIYASEIQTPLIEAEAGVFKKLKADDATVVGLLDVKGQLHTNSWSNSNIATIDGSFYITPTIGSASGTVTITASTLTFSGTNYAVSSLYLGDGSSITWPRYSKVLVTGQILSNGEWIPLGTLLGQLSSTATAASISINNIKDNKNQTSNVLATLVNEGTTSSSYRNLKVSLYQRASSSTAFYPLGIYMTATGTNGRTFLDIYGGVEALSNNNNYGGLAEPNVRIGNLQGLPNVGGQTPSGWGIYTDNGYFKGIIAADRGYIGTGSKYWVIANEEDLSNSENSRSYIYNGTNSITSTTTGVYLGTDGIRNYKDSTHYVTIKDGVISALGADLSGKIVATSGTIGGWNIGTDTNKSLYHGNQTPGATTTNLVLSPTSATNSNAIGGSATGLNWFLSAGKVFGVTTAGALYATSGKIGGWNIDSNSFATGSWGTNNSAMLCIGTSGSKSIGGSDSINNWVFTAGANFGVTKSGALYANSANISGKVVATSGSIGGIEIENGVLKVSSINIGNLGGASNYAQKTDVTQAIDNIEIGGRNLLKKSNNLKSTDTTKGITFTYLEDGWFAVKGTVTGTSAGILCFYGSSQHTSNISGSGEYTLSIETNGTIFLPSNKTFIQLAYHSDNATNNTIAGEFEILSGSTKVTFTIPENHHISRVCLFIRANATGGVVDGNIRLKLEKGNKATDWTPAPEDIQDGIDHAQNIANVALSQSVEYIIGTQTAVTGSWTGISNTISELKDGTQIRYWLPCAGSGNATLNLTLTNGTTTGAIPIYRQGGSVSNGNVVANRVTTHFPTGSVVSMTYGVDRSISVVSSGTTYTGLFTGWFADGAYDSGNTINRVRLQNVITAETAITAGHIICGTANGYKNIGANISFDLSYPLLYASSAISASKTGDNNFLSINGVSATNNGTVQSGAAKKTLYLKGQVTGNTFKISASPFMTTAQPTTDDGYYYIPLGIMYSTTAIYFQSSNRLYAYIDGAFQPVDTAAVLRAEEAKKVATNYLSVDSTGIMIADMNDGEQTPSEATGRNVFIDNNSVDIRNGTSTLASFTGDNTKFYDPIYNKELATFGASGAMIGVEGEQRFVIEKDSVRAINSSGGTLFSIVSTDKTFITEAEAAPSGECSDYLIGDVTRTLDAGDSTTDNSFYIDRIYIIVSLTNSSKVLTNVKINSIAATADRIKYNTNTEFGFAYSSSHSIDVPFSPAFSCNYGTSKSSNYVMTATFVNDYGDSYNLTFSFKITYNGARKLTFSQPTKECIRTSGNNETIAKFDALNPNKYVFSQVISSTANTRAPAMTFGTRTGEDGMLSSAFGQGLYAEKDGEFVIGRYNNQELQTDSKYSFIIGNGEDNEHRSNALTIDWSGNICFGVNVAGSETNAELVIAITNAGWDDDVYDD